MRFFAFFLAAVLFLHGGGQTRHAWGNTARAVAAAGWHAITMDLRGHGESERSPDGDYCPDPMVAGLRRVVARCLVALEARRTGAAAPASAHHPRQASAPGALPIIIG